MPCKNVAVIGGANIDIIAKPDHELRLYDSNPGRAVLSFGGVGRNISENLVKLGLSVRFITVFGGDSFSEALKADCRAKGIDISFSKTIEGAACSKYICMNSHNGDMIAAINDMSLYEHMGEALTDDAFAAINEADMLIMDANTSEEHLKMIASKCRVPIAFDAVSVSKVSRALCILDRLFLFKPNIYEAAALCGEEYEAETAQGRQKSYITDNAKRYAGILRQKGVRNIMISLGKYGVYYENSEENGIIPSLAKTIVNTSGCGDAFLSGAVKGFLDGCSLKEMAVSGSSAAAACAACEETVAPALL